MSKKELANIGERIKTLIKESGLTQKQLSTKVGISEAKLSLYVNNANEPSLVISSRIADALGVPLDYLVNGRIEPVERLVESKTGLSSESVRYLKRISKYCSDENIPNPVNQLIEKTEFQECINELLCSILILLNGKHGTTNESTRKLVHKLNVSHIINGGDFSQYNGMDIELARLHAEDAKTCVEKAIDKVRMEVWNDGKRNEEN